MMISSIENSRKYAAERNINLQISPLIVMYLRIRIILIGIKHIPTRKNIHMFSRFLQGGLTFTKSNRAAAINTYPITICCMTAAIGAAKIPATAMGQLHLIGVFLLIEHILLSQKQ